MKEQSTRPGASRSMFLQRGDCGGSGGESGIRTRVTVSRKHTFQACAFNHSATSPRAPGLGTKFAGAGLI